MPQDLKSHIFFLFQSHATTVLAFLCASFCGVLLVCLSKESIWQLLATQPMLKLLAILFLPPPQFAQIIWSWNELTQDLVLAIVAVAWMDSE